MGSSVNVVTELGAGSVRNNGSISGRGKGTHTSAECPHRLWSPSDFPLTDTKRSFAGLKQPGRKAEYSPPSFAQVQNVWGCTFTASRSFMAFNGTASLLAFAYYYYYYYYYYMIWISLFTDFFFLVLLLNQR